MSENVRNLAEKIAAELGANVDTDPRWDDHRCVYIDLPTPAEPELKARLVISQDWKDTSKLRIDGAEGAYRDGSIGVTASRGVATIANEIRRRLVPVYLEWLREFRVQEARTRANEQARDTLTRELAGIVGGELYDDSRHRAGRPGEFHRWRHSGPVQSLDVRVRHDGTEITEIELRYVSVDMARRILAVIAEG